RRGLLPGRLGDAALDEQVPGAMSDPELTPGGPQSPTPTLEVGAPGGVTPPPDVPTGAVEGSATWSLLDRLGLAFCWFLGLLFCAIAAAIVIYLLIKGIQYLRPSQLV